METELLALMEKQILHTDFKPKSSFYPHWAKGKFIPIFHEIVFDQIKKICQNNHPNGKYINTKDQEIPKEIPKKFQEREDLIIRQADKGGGLVIQNRDDYMAEALRLLGDINTYEKRPADPLPSFAITLKFLLDQARENGVITKSESLNKQHPLTPHFYHITKIHKDQTHHRWDRQFNK